MSLAQELIEKFQSLPTGSQKEVVAFIEFLKYRDRAKEAEAEGSVYLNHYRCPLDDTRWTDQWSCTCNDRCPVCRAEIEPYYSEELLVGSTHSE